MSPETTCILNAVLRELPLDEQLFALIAVIVERKPGAVNALVSLTSALAVMGDHLCERERIALAEIVRDCADHIEVVQIG